MNKSKKFLFFIVGTEAELMKLFPVINSLKNNGFICKIVVTGQNDVRKSPFLTLVNEDVFMDISGYTPIKKNMIEYFKWIFFTTLNGKKTLSMFFKDKDRKYNLIVVHGDTITTVIGALLAKICKVPYIHIESGLRSNNFLSPFPEEFDRMFGSSFSVINFCPKIEYANYASKRFKGKSINTFYNTGIETLLWALEKNGEYSHNLQPKDKYFLFMIHRQENLKSRNFLINTTKYITMLCKKIHCVFIFHEQTSLYMMNAGVFNSFSNNSDVTLLPRQGYEDFIKLVKFSEFVITDGCGNQQELYYLGKPHLIMRTSVEKESEGIGWNAKLFNNDFSSIFEFYQEYCNFQKNSIIPDIKPSTIIVNEVTNYFNTIQNH